MGVKRYLAGVGVEWRRRARDGGVQTGGGDSSETGSVTKKDGKQKSTTDIGGSLTSDFKNKEESNNNIHIRKSAYDNGSSNIYVAISKHNKAKS